MRAGARLRAEPARPTSTFDPARVGWSEIRMTASKLFLTAEARLTLRTVPGATVVPICSTSPPAGSRRWRPGTEVLELLYDARGGRAADPGSRC